VQCENARARRASKDRCTQWNRRLSMRVEPCTCFAALIACKGPVALGRGRLVCCGAEVPGSRAAACATAGLACRFMAGDERCCCANHWPPECGALASTATRR
jgi:hypothetical protein